MADHIPPNLDLDCVLVGEHDIGSASEVEAPARFAVRVGCVEALEPDEMDARTAFPNGRSILYLKL